MSMLFMVILAAGLVAPLNETVVTPEWLQQNLDNPAVILVEIGSSPTADHPHIPGARFVDIDSIVVREGWPPDQLPDVERLRRAFENAGVGDEGRIVLYSLNPLYATRAWFTLDYLGHGSRASVLDGGFRQWQAEKRPVAQKRLPRLAKTFTARADSSRVILHADMRKAVEAGEVMLDARSPSEFHGFRRGQQVVRRGHIPGAHCEPWQVNLNQNGTFRTPEELKKIYASLISLSDTRVIVYCRTGMEASMPYMVLRSLGYNAVLYDGSYTEWARDKAAPRAWLSSRR